MVGNVLQSETEPDEELEVIEANADRITAAVNACKGIPTEALKSGVVGELLAVCETAVRFFDGRLLVYPGSHLAREIMDAVAKARGEKEEE